MIHFDLNIITEQLFPQLWETLTKFQHSRDFSLLFSYPNSKETIKVNYDLLLKGA